MISHTCSYMAAYGFALSLTRGLRIESELRVGTFLPMLYHVGDQPFTYSVFLSGGTLILGRKPDPGRIAEMIAEERVTALWAGSPAMVNAVDAVLTARPELDARSLKVIVYGWAALPPATLASLKQHCGEDLLVFEIFGQTESISCHRFWPDKWPELYARTAPKQNYVGVPSPLLASTVLDPEGRDLRSSPGTPGEAVYRSPSMMSGYYRDEAATREAFRFGWFHSGQFKVAGRPLRNVPLVLIAPSRRVPCTLIEANRSPSGVSLCITISMMTSPVFETSPVRTITIFFSGPMNH
jgi:acyl-CoA synthetase (AMP-forming)/AMP-acid ligase II